MLLFGIVDANIVDVADVDVDVVVAATTVVGIAADVNAFDVIVDMDIAFLIPMLRSC